MEAKEQLIDTAVKFLQNAKVRNTPLAKRKEFLKQKGLTDDEVAAAISRAGITEELPQTVAAPQQVHYPVRGEVLQPVAEWRWRGIIGLVMLIAGATYGVYRLLIEHIIPWMRGRSSKDDEVHQSIQYLHQSIEQTSHDLQQTLLGLQRIMREQNDKIDALCSKLSQDDPITSSANSRQNSQQQLTQIKSEIISLKGLMLNKNVFPPVPKTTLISGSSSGPTLPAWQMEKPGDSGDKVVGDHTSSGDKVVGDHASSGDKVDGDHTSSGNKVDGDHTSSGNGDHKIIGDRIDGDHTMIVDKKDGDYSSIGDKVNADHASHGGKVSGDNTDSGDKIVHSFTDDSDNKDGICDENHENDTCSTCATIEDKTDDCGNSEDNIGRSNASMDGKDDARNEVEMGDVRNSENMEGDASNEDKEGDASNEDKEGDASNEDNKHNKSSEENKYKGDNVVLVNGIV